MSKGPFAFPRPGNLMDDLSKGMTLRDYFAAHFMATAYEISFAIKEYEPKQIFNDRNGITRQEIASTIAYKMADAMVARRDVKPEKN